MALTKEELRAYHRAYKQRPDQVAKAKAYYVANKDKFKASSKRRLAKRNDDTRAKERKKYSENRERVWGYQVKFKYNLTLEQFNALLAKQENRCPICTKHFTAKPLEKEDNLTMIKPHIDHDHATGKVRGLLCGSCNRGLGIFSDNLATLLNAGCYLENPPNGR